MRDYQRLEDERYGIQITFVMIFILVALLVLLSAVWLGLNFANRIAHPIGGLIAAADRVRAGELAARVEEPPQDDEIGLAQPGLQSDDRSNPQPAAGAARRQPQLDDRRRFTEAVLAGVSAGVIGLDAEGRITLPNPSALTLLNARQGGPRRPRALETQFRKWPTCWPRPGSQPQPWSKIRSSWFAASTDAHCSCVS